MRDLISNELDRQTSEGFYLIVLSFFLTGYGLLLNLFPQEFLSLSIIDKMIHSVFFGSVLFPLILVIETIMKILIPVISQFPGFESKDYKWHYTLRGTVFLSFIIAAVLVLRYYLILV